MANADVIRHKIGGKVILTQAHVEHMWELRGTGKDKNYPCKELIQQAQSIAHSGLTGVVTAYSTLRQQVTVQFGPLSLMLKSNWVDKIEGDK